ncbi:MAG: hypothetical protein U9Q82_09375 [Chloroflexota bacterium]|nr:hypothetical protein [Chloroflexota bacterium]
MKNHSKSKTTMRLLITTLIVVIFTFAFRDFYAVAAGTTNWVGKFTLTWGIPLAGLIVWGTAATIWGLLSLWRPETVSPANRFLSKWRNRIGWLRWPIVVVLALILAKIFLYTPLGLKLTGLAFRLVFFMAVVIAAAMFATRGPELINLRSLLLASLLVGGVFILAKSLITVTDYPLSLSWSEGNRIWDYSILYGRDLYNYPPDQRIEAYIDRGRQSLWGLPFLFANVSIVHVRLWSALVFTIPYALLGWSTFRALAGHIKEWAWLGVWIFLFLYQGPIYTPLVLSAILVAGARRKPLWIGLPLIYLAGYYAQMSRMTWMVAPALWAIIIALVDGISEQDNGSFGWREWGKIIASGLAGFLGGFGIERGWRRISFYLGQASADEALGLSPSIPASDLAEPALSAAPITNMGVSGISDQPLLWERLWPNPTCGTGLIIGLLLAVAPVIILLVYLIRTKRWNLNRWQKLGIFVILSAFLTVGIIISVKIGGGSNLHNLDMFLIGLVFTAALAWENGGYELLTKLLIIQSPCPHPSPLTEGEGTTSSPPGGGLRWGSERLHPLWIKSTLLLAVMIPAFMPLIKAAPLELPPDDKVEWTMELLSAETKRITSEGEEILFMDQRQTLTFGYFGDVPLVPEYEKKKLMDKALSGDMEYLSSFYADIASQRFALIITDPQRVRYADEDEGWGAENDVWVRWVTEPLLCYYEPIYTIKKTSVWFLYPRADASDCSIP